MTARRISLCGLLGMAVSLAVLAVVLWPTQGEAGGQPPTMTVLAEHPLGAISPLLRGVNHRYHECGTGSWDCEAHQPMSAVIEAARASEITLLRFPGGTVSSPYHWTDGVGPVARRPSSISGFTGAPIPNDYGFDEHMILVEAVGGETTVVVNFGSGTAEEAAAWVAYANGDPADPTALGVDRLGRDWETIGYWASMREMNQRALGRSPHPYHIRYWEIGNELYGDWEFSWTHNPVQYAVGGTAWQEDQWVRKPRDWRQRAATSDGGSNQTFYFAYPPVVRASQTVSVGGEVWEETADLASAGPNDQVYQFDPQSGAIRFGDGAHGRIPPQGTMIRASYESGPHDGFIDFYRAMKAVDPMIEVGSCFHSAEFLIAMGGARPYDFVVRHLYAVLRPAPPDGETAHRWIMAFPHVMGQVLQELRNEIDLYAGSRASEVELFITEYNLKVPPESAPTPDFVQSLSQALYVADLLRVFSERGIRVAQLHPLITPTGRGAYAPLIGPPPHFTRRAVSYVLELYSHLAGERVDNLMDNIPTYSLSYRGETYGIPYLEGLAARDSEGNRLTLLVINKHPTEAITAVVKIEGFAPSSRATVYTLNGSSLEAFDAPDHPTDVVIKQSVFSGAAESFSYDFAAHSATLIELVKRPTENAASPSPAHQGGGWAASDDIFMAGQLEAVLAGSAPGVRKDPGRSWEVCRLTVEVSQQPSTGISTCANLFTDIRKNSHLVIGWNSSGLAVNGRIKRSMVSPQNAEGLFGDPPDDGGDRR